MSDKATLSEIREAYVRPQGLFGHYGMETRARDFDAAIAEVVRAAAEKALTCLAEQLETVDPGTKRLTITPEFLRARAEAYRREGKE